MDITARLHELRHHAKMLIERDFAAISGTLEPFIEDVVEEKGQPRELLFIWTKPGTEVGVSVTLTPDGDLIDYAVDPGLHEDKDLNVHLSEEHLLELGERFVRDHYADAPEQFGSVEIERYEDRLFCTCKQVAAGMPLPRSGFWIDMHRAGFVTSFKYFGKHDEPSLSHPVWTEKEVLEQIAANLEMKLQFTLLHESVYTQGDDCLHLVYIPEPYLTSYPACPVDAPLKSTDSAQIEKEQADNSTSMAIADKLALYRSTMTSTPSPLTLLGLNEDEYEVVREVDMGDEQGTIYRKKEVVTSAVSQDTSAPYTLNSYMHNQNDGTVKIRRDQASGQLTGAMNFNTQKGNLALEDHECLELALRLIAAAEPDMAPYLWLEESEDAEPSDQVHFHFPMSKQGVPGFLHSLSVNVDRTTGTISHYMKGGVPAQQLETLSVVPALSAEEAKKRLLEQLQPQLVWEVDYEHESPEIQYKPTYKLLDRESGLSIRMIEASTGEILTDML